MNKSKQSIAENKLFILGCNTVITKGKQVLLGKRKGDYGAGTWGLPGGHLEYGEDLIDGARRELMEEVGIENPKLEFLSVVEGSRDKGHYIQINFILENFTGEIKHMEPELCEEWKFFDLDNLPEDLFPPHKNILEAYENREPYYPMKHPY